MIDWFGVLSAAIWILGLALLLATMSIAYSSATDKSLLAVLGKQSYRLALTVGLVLFALGMMLSVEAWWERIGWLLVMGLGLWDGVAAWRISRVK
ncbi:MAG: hypothetical protein HZB51_30405 [Chloroflexi bacterium]|nr:hypothetical protein [Chloroflexota bacterium]